MDENNNKNRSLNKMIKVLLAVFLIGISVATTLLITGQFNLNTAKKVDESTYAKDEYQLDDSYDVSISGIKDGYTNSGKYSGVCYWYIKTDNVKNPLSYQGRCIGYGMSDLDFQFFANDNIYTCDNNPGYLWVFTLTDDNKVVPIYTNLDILISSTPLQ